MIASLGAGDDEVEVAFFELGRRWAASIEFAVDVADADGGDGAVEGDVGDAERGAEAAIVPSVSGGFSISTEKIVMIS